ncbi:MAG: hypothetical protein J0G29_07755, partial [Alphaproteobacteria bacterium]|nr:hypothetical protein [Alphaproteobacteria bacterium]
VAHDGAHQNATKAAYGKDNHSAGNEADGNGKVAPATSATVTNDNTSFAFDGDQGNNSGTVIIEQIKQLAGQFRVFNFGVDTYHTYFIGDGIYVLVHNPINAFDVDTYSALYALSQDEGRATLKSKGLEIHHLMSAEVWTDGRTVADTEVPSIALPKELHLLTGSNNQNRMAAPDGSTTKKGTPSSYAKWFQGQESVFKRGGDFEGWFNFVLDDLGRANKAYIDGGGPSGLTRAHFLTLIQMNKHIDDRAKSRLRDKIDGYLSRIAGGGAAAGASGGMATRSGGYFGGGGGGGGAAGGGGGGCG